MGSPQRLATSRLPLAPLFWGENGRFKIPLYVVEEDKATSKTFGYLSGRMSLEAIPQSDDPAAFIEASHQAEASTTSFGDNLIDFTGADLK